MLELRGECERCHVALRPETPGAALVCSFECTFCVSCGDELMGVCPNCGGDLQSRPTRAGDALRRHPPLHERPSRTTQLTRKPERQTEDREELYAFLDSQLVGTLASVVDGEPWVVPMLFGRDGDHILLHGSTGAGLLRHTAAGAPVAFSVTAIDGLVVAESTFESSANYRSAVIRGRLVALEGVTEAEALETISERLLPGRPGEVGRSTRKEVAATLALALEVTDDNWLMKTRAGAPGDPGSEVSVWCGVIPLAMTAGQPLAAPWAVGPVPTSVTDFVAARPAP